MPNKILTVSELAEHLNVHRITIYRLLKSGTLPGFKIGRVWRFELDEISNWMATGKSVEAMKAAAADGQLDGHPPDRQQNHPAAMDRASSPHREPLRATLRPSVDGGRGPKRKH
jgi:excisionase family DNA binding protein